MTAVELTVAPVTATVGAELDDLDLSAPLAPERVAAVREALLRWRVIFVRDQHLTPGQLVAFGRSLGALTPAHPLVPGLDDEHPEVLVLDSEDYPLGVGDRTEATSYNNRWHTDVTFSAQPPMASVLAARQVPAVGGDTLWADLVGAYRSLSPAVQRFVDPLVAVHHAGSTFDRFQDDDANRARVGALVPVRHPVVRIHPETGEAGLFVNPVFTDHIEGFSRTESAAVLGMLYDQIEAPEHVVRWRWRAGDVAVWDNRATSHYAVADYTGRHVMHRITVGGDAPFGATAAG